MNKYTVMAAGLVLSLGLVAGCGSSDGEEPAGAPKNNGSAGSGGAAGSGGGAAPQGPAYGGPAVPGLAAKAAWSLAGANANAIDLGDTFLFVKDAEGAYALGEKYGTDDPIDGSVGTLHFSNDPEPVTLEFRDVKTGEVRKTLKVTTDRVAATTWHDGVRAVAVFAGATTESDGLSAEKTTTTVTVYGSDGTELGKAQREGDKFHVAEGHVIEQDGDESLKLTPIDGGAARKVTCTGQLASCSYDPRSNQIDGSQAHAPLITGKYAFHVENASNYENKPEQLVMTELATGKKVWSTADVTPPAGVELTDGKRTTGNLRVMEVRDGKILTAWGVSALSPDTWVTATYDLASGKQLGGSTTYSYADSPHDTVDMEGRSVLSPDRTLAAAETKDGTAVWQPADGKEVWKQKEEENAMQPLRFSPGGVLYGVTKEDQFSETVYLAVDGRTKKVLAKSLPEEYVPLFSRSGYGYMSTEKGFFVFPPAG
ncbi:PQQ-binding-like beta-propeller repeat protein [Streptomyces ficellus]|uniref:PQQ-binding-like beta-propeller repeat protein n=1 Tax=Streptomyces ficellus TaxID=1977088 RepID=A0A6I6FLA6_9ACTN|nr:PQQ-binding-like beta-propeller repeat protein [Streptomyces ficellus]QGV78318.1 hypothetical protein EIZ62_08745 [Streptomyces ficellus]